MWYNAACIFFTMETEFCIQPSEKEKKQTLTFCLKSATWEETELCERVSYIERPINDS